MRVSTFFSLASFCMAVSTLAYSDTFIKKTLAARGEPNYLVAMIPSHGENSSFRGAFVLMTKESYHYEAAANLLLCDAGDFLFWGAAGMPSLTTTCDFLGARGKVTPSVVAEIRGNVQNSFLPFTSNNTRVDLDFQYFIEKLNLAKTPHQSDESHNVFQMARTRNLNDNVDSGRVSYLEFIGTLWTPKNRADFDSRKMEQEMERSTCEDFLAGLSDKISIVHAEHKTSEPEGFFSLLHWWQDKAVRIKADDSNMLP